MLTTLTAQAGAVVAHGFGSGFGPGFGFPVFAFLIPLFWLVVVVVLVAVFGRRFRRAAAWRHSGVGSAEATLAQRYANGDIEEQEYRARLEVLRANRPPQ